MLGKTIKEYLDNHGISQVFVSEKTGITLPILNAILNEKRKITAQEYFKICDALGVSLEMFKNEIINKAG